MKISRIMALSLIFSLAVSPITVSAMQSEMDQAIQEQKKKSFWQRHKGKLKAGLVVAGLAATAALVYFHAGKTMRAIEKASIDKDDPERPEAIKIVALLGPLGAKKTLWTINKAIPSVLSAQEAGALVLSKTGAALAHYFGMDPVTFRGMAAAEGIKKVGGIIRDEVKKGSNKLINWLS